MGRERRRRSVHMINGSAEEKAEEEDGKDWNGQRERERERGIRCAGNHSGNCRGGVPSFYAVFSTVGEPVFPTPFRPCDAIIPFLPKTELLVPRPAGGTHSYYVPRKEAKGRDKFPSPSGLLSPGNRSCIICRILHKAAAAASVGKKENRRKN